MFSILVADDLDPFRKQLCEKIRQIDNGTFTVLEEASDGQEALDILRTKQVDILFTDIVMPGISGLQLLEIVKKERLCKCVILMSEYAEFEYARKGLVLGAFDFMVKPIEETMLEQLWCRVNTTLVEEEYGLQEIVTCMKEQGAELDSILSECCRRYSGDGVNAIRYVIRIRSYLELVRQEIVKTHPWLDYIVLHVKEIERYMLKTDDKSQIRKIACSYIKSIYFAILEYLPKVKSEITIRTLQYVLNHPFEKVTLSKMADLNYVSNAYLSHLFKQEVGISFVSYMCRYKIDIIKRILLSSNQTIEEIAEQVGFEDYKYMGRVFKNRTGYSLSGYRKLLEH